MSDQKKCVYCCDDDDREKYGEVKIPIGDTSIDVELWVGGDLPMADVYFARDHFVPRSSFTQIITMNYCPVCGRKL